MLRTKKFWVLVGVIAVFVGSYYWLHRDEITALPYLDTSPKVQAGRCLSQTGRVFSKIAVDSDHDFRISPVPTMGDSQWTGVQKDALMWIGMLYRLDPNASAQFMTTGNWLIGLDGEGEFIFDDAKRDQQSITHNIIWTVKQGMFRARPHVEGGGTYSLEVRTSVARILVHQGEIGLRLEREGQGGQLWRRSGKVVVHWNDGRRLNFTQEGVTSL